MVYLAPNAAPLLLVRERALEYAGTWDSADEAPDPGVAPDAGGSSDAAVPDPFDDCDALEELEEQIASLAAHIHAATHRLLTLIADFDRRRGWELGGHRSCAHWLHFRTGIDLGAARQKVRTARALEFLPGISASMARGELSFSKVRALVRVATAENESELLEFAQGCTTAELERMVRGYRRGSREDEQAWEQRRFERRALSVFPDEDGMYVVKGRLPPEVGVLLMRAVEAASDALYREDRGPVPDEESERAATQRRADALGLLAERALAAGFGGRTGGGAEGETGSATTMPVPISGTRAERYQVVLHVEAETPEGEGDDGSYVAAAHCSANSRGVLSGRTPHFDDGSYVAPAHCSANSRGVLSGRTPHFDDGSLVSAEPSGSLIACALRSRLVIRETAERSEGETSRRISCDAGVVRVSHAPGGSILDVGRRTRTIPPAIRRALEFRDRGCRFPGCGLRFAEGHHITHWAEGGETKLENLLLACRFHHRLLHEEGWKVDWWGEGRPVFFDPRGGTHFDGRWKWPEAEEEPVQALIEHNRRCGVEPDGWTASARWKRQADIPAPIYFRALEAVGEAGL